MIRLSDKETVDTGNELLKMLTILYSHHLSAAEKKKQLSEQYGMRMTKHMEGSLENTCNLSEGVWEDWIRVGEARGEARGKELGLKQGLQKCIQEVLSNLGVISDVLQEKISAEDNIEVLNHWFKAAFHSKSMDEFMNRISL